MSLSSRSLPTAIAAVAALALGLSACAPSTEPVEYAAPEGPAEGLPDPAFLAGAEQLAVFEDVITPVSSLASEDGTMIALVTEDPDAALPITSVYEAEDPTVLVWSGECGFRIAWFGNGITCGEGVLDPRTGETQPLPGGAWSLLEGPEAATSEYLVMGRGQKWVGVDRSHTQLWEIPAGGFSLTVQEGSAFADAGGSVLDLRTGEVIVPEGNEGGASATAVHLLRDTYATTTGGVLTAWTSNRQVILGAGGSGDPCRAPFGSLPLDSDAVQCPRAWVDARGDDAVWALLRGPAELHAVTLDADGVALDGEDLPVSSPLGILGLFVDHQHVLLDTDDGLTLWDRAAGEPAWTVDSGRIVELVRGDRLATGLWGDPWSMAITTVRLYAPAS